MNKRSARLTRALWFAALLTVVTVFAAIVSSLAAQTVVPPPPSVASPDSVMVKPGPEYEAGGFHEFVLGANYRVFWNTPIKVPVLDLRTFAGGVEPKKKGGGMQTESLKLETKDGTEYAFRSVDKRAHLPWPLKGELAKRLIADQISSEHPAAAVVAARLLEAAGVLHATPQFALMPADPALGEFEKEFAGKLGLIEVSPGKTSHGEGFAGAREIIDSDSLRTLLDRDGREHIDERAMLTARLMDVYLNDIDRHPGQWKWARMKKDEKAAWEPIPRDRDQAFVAYHGALLRAAHVALPNIVTFDGNISIPGLTYNSLQMDRRLLSGMERPVWDSIANFLTARLTDAVIDSAVHMMPPEYQWYAPEFASILRLRRAHLQKAATTFYLYLANVVDVHGTDAADRLRVSRVADGLVRVKLETMDGVPFFNRVFDSRETHEIRVYLHGGNDSSVVDGDARRSISVKVIGGNGVNWLVDSSRVDGRPNPTELVDNGTVEGVEYGKDTLFQRLPFIERNGKSVEPGPDRGSKIAPVVGLRSELELGIVPKLGVEKYTYGFRDRPYSSVVSLDGEYAFSFQGYAVHAYADKRWERTPFHVEMAASVTEFSLLSYRGLGNNAVDSDSDFFDVRQRQWRFRPAIGVALGPTTDLSLGPIFRYTSSDSTPGTFLAQMHPYGTWTFRQAGAQLSYHHEIADNPGAPRQKFLVDIEGTYYPAVLDVVTPYEVASAHIGSFITFPIVTDPVLVWRAGGTKVWGAFPFFDAAFLGGNRTLREMQPNLYAGDASLYISSELRIPLMSFAVFVPMRAGILGLAEAGRVYLNGNSPGGWHTVTGGGVWAGFASQSFIVSCVATNESGHAGIHCQTGLGL